MRVAKAFVLDPAEGQPARMVVDLTPVDRETFLRAVAIDNHLPRPPDPAHRERDTAGHSADPRPVVVLDPGHGGIDNGTRARSGELEKDMVLEFASMLRDKLEKSGQADLSVVVLRGGKEIELPRFTISPSGNTASSAST